MTSTKFEFHGAIAYRLVAGLVIALSLVLALKFPNDLRRTRMPDAWAYAFATENFANGDWVISEEELSAAQMQARLEGGHLVQYVSLGDDRWALEKAPGFPLLAVPFQWLKLPQLTNSFLAVLAAVTLYVVVARWRDEGLACLALVIFLLAPMTLMAQRELWMDTFASGIVAIVGGALYALYGLRAKADAVGLLLLFGAGLSLGWAVVVRMTNLPLLGLCGLHLLVSLWQERQMQNISRAKKGAKHKSRLDQNTATGNVIRVLLAFSLGAGLALGWLLRYNQIVFGRPFDTGYAYSSLRITSALGPAIGKSNAPASSWNAWNALAAVKIMVGNLLGSLLPWLAGFPLLLLALPGWYLTRIRQAGSKMLVPLCLSTLWILAVMIPYLSFTWLAQLLERPWLRGDYFVDIDRYFFPWLFPLIVLALATLERLPRRLALGLVGLYAIGSLWLYSQAI